MSEIVEIRPQPGAQEAFLSSAADVVFYGGAAGGGKSYALLLEPLRHIATVDGFGAVCFRRETPQITNEGGLWDDSQNLYPLLNGRSRQSYLDWTFPPYGNKIKFAHMERASDRYGWDSSQIPLILFDQLEQFERLQFLYMFSRNRSTCGVRPYIRAGYNPVPADDPVGGWIHEFVGWYLDDNLEYPDPAKAGIVRWFANINDTLHWFDDRETAVAAFPDIPPKSFTFIPSSVYDNKILLEINPDYLANLYALPPVEQERLLGGNHKIKPAAGKVFNRGWFEIVDMLPNGPRRHVRFWDLAATERKLKSGAATAGIKMCRIGHIYYIVDCIEEWVEPGDTDNLITNTASQDGYETAVRFEQEPGASGKRDAFSIMTMLAGYDVDGISPTGDKLSRSRALASQAKAGNVKLLRGHWNDNWLNHMHAIPDGARFDIHDASAGAFNHLAIDIPKRRAQSYSMTHIG